MNIKYVTQMRPRDKSEPYLWPMKAQTLVGVHRMCMRLSTLQHAPVEEAMQETKSVKLNRGI